MSDAEHMLYGCAYAREGERLFIIITTSRLHTFPWNLTFMVTIFVQQMSAL